MTAAEVQSRFLVIIVVWGSVETFLPGCETRPANHCSTAKHLARRKTGTVIPSLPFAASLFLETSAPRLLVDGIFREE